MIVDYIFWVFSVVQGSSIINEITLCKVSEKQISFEGETSFVIPLEFIRSVEKGFSGAKPPQSWVELTLITHKPPFVISFANPFNPRDKTGTVTETEQFAELVQAFTRKQPVPAIEPNPYLRQYPRYKRLVEKPPPNGWDPYLHPIIAADRYFKKPKPITWRDILVLMLIFGIILLIIALVFGASIQINY